MTAPSGDATASGGHADQGTSAPLPEAFAEIVDDFHAVSGNDRVQMLLEFADDLPELPERYRDHPELLEPVPECQSPIFVITEVDGQGEDAPARLFFSAPPEAPTTRGFAGILAAGLEGLTVGEIRAVPADVTENLGLAEVVSPLRLRGMAGMLGRIKRQLGEKAGLQ